MVSKLTKVVPGSNVYLCFGDVVWNMICLTMNMFPHPFIFCVNFLNMIIWLLFTSNSTIKLFSSTNFDTIIFASMANRKCQGYKSVEFINSKILFGTRNK